MRKAEIALVFAWLAACATSVQAQPCPRIERRGDTLFAVPADASQYRWYKNGNVLSGQSQNFVVMDENAEYAVEAFGISAPRAVMPVTVKPQGRVFDPVLQPVAGATVRIGAQIQTTDAQGRYLFEAVEVLAGRNVVKIEKAGYFAGYSAVAFDATPGAEKSAATMLHPKENPVVFIASQGLLLSNADFSLNIPPRAVARANGQAYDGPVNLHYRHLDPDYPWFGFGMPGGDFQASAATGETVTLTSYGVVGVEMTDANGNTLNLREGSTARIAMRIPEGMNLQATAALWHFDENAGLRHNLRTCGNGSYRTAG